MEHRNRLDSTPLPIDLSKLPAHLRPAPSDSPRAADLARAEARPRDAAPAASAWGDYIAQFEGKEL